MVCEFIVAERQIEKIVNACDVSIVYDSRFCSVLLLCYGGLVTRRL